MSFSDAFMYVPKLLLVRCGEKKIKFGYVKTTKRLFFQKCETEISVKSRTLSPQILATQEEVAAKAPISQGLLKVFLG